MTRIPTSKRGTAASGSFAIAHFIDHRHGDWYPELDDDLRPFDLFFTGKPDIYHSLQACLIPLFPATGSITKVAVEAS